MLHPLLLSSDGIVKYMRAQVGPSSRELKSVAEYEAFLAKDDVAVIGFFDKESDLKVLAVLPTDWFWVDLITHSP